MKKELCLFLSQWDHTKNTNYTANYHKSTHDIFILYFCPSLPPFSQELYVAYNSLSDLSQVGMLENLQLLDLEGNDVDDLVQVQYLGLCGKLQTLTLEGNPVCFCPNPAAVQVE